MSRRPGRTPWRFLPVTLLTPALASSLGIDGGALFQILAVENLGLSAAAIGIAFGLGVVSLPFQVLAARIPLRRARRNVQWFLLMAAVQCWVLAWLVAVGATGGPAVIALAVTVTAEVALSVLYATAWQPLLSHDVDPIARQRLNSWWTALARGVLAGILVAFAALSGEGRAIFLAAIGVLAVAAAIGLQRVQSPGDAEGEASLPRDPAATRRLPPTVRTVFLVLGVLNFAALPLWLVYLNDVLWPSANLGAIGAIQTAASVAALLAWRATDAEPLRQARGGMAAVLVGALALVALSEPSSSAGGRVGVAAVTILMSGGATTVRLALLEVTHRLIDRRSIVRAFTLLDVVASTSLQVGLLTGGLLVTVSQNARWLFGDPYRVLVLACTIGAAAALHRLRRVVAAEADGA